MELDGSLAVSGDSRWCYLLHIPYIRHVTEIIGNESVVPQPIYAIVYANLGLMGNFPFTDLTRLVTCFVLSLHSLYSGFVCDITKDSVSAQIYSFFLFIYGID